MSYPWECYKGRFVKIGKITWTMYVMVDFKHDARGNVGNLSSFILSLSMIVMGGIHIGNCPAEHYIPIYLVVNGSFAIFVAVLRVMWRNFLQDDEGWKPVVLTGISALISIFQLAWFIAGNVWIYRLYGNYSTDPAAPNYCDNNFYLYAFWITTVTYILIGLSLLCLCCQTCIFSLCCSEDLEDLDV